MAAQKENHEGLEAQLDIRKIMISMTEIQDSRPEETGGETKQLRKSVQWAQ